MRSPQEVLQQIQALTAGLNPQAKILFEKILVASRSANVNIPITEIISFCNKIQAARALHYDFPAGWEKFVAHATLEDWIQPTLDEGRALRLAKENPANSLERSLAQGMTWQQALHQEMGERFADETPTPTPDLADGWVDVGAESELAATLSKLVITG